MANGVAAPHALVESRGLPKDSEVPSTSTRMEDEHRIGEVVACAVLGFCGAWLAFQSAGALARVVRAQSGEVLGALCALRLTHFDDTTFAAIARREGRKVLYERHAATLSAMAPAEVEAGLDQILSWVIDIADQVVADELTSRLRHCTRCSSTPSTALPAMARTRAGSP
jgi:hypothetical protein